VQEVLPRVGHSRVRPGHLHRGLDAVMGARLAAGQPALVPPETLLVPFPVLRVRDLLPIGKDGQVGQPEIEAYLLPGGGDRDRIGRVYVEGHKPAPGRVFRHGYRGGIKAARVDIRPRPHISDSRVRLREPQHSAAHGEGATGVSGGLPSAPRLEPGVAGAPGEERAERLVLVPQRLLQRHARHLREESEFRIALQRGQRRVGGGIRQALAFGVVQPVPCRQDLIPDQADAPERARQHLLLRLVRICPAPVSCPHAYRIESTFVKCREARRTYFVSGVKMARTSVREAE
jgi:hypothetical protein